MYNIYINAYSIFMQEFFKKIWFDLQGGWLLLSYSI